MTFDRLNETTSLTHKHTSADDLQDQERAFNESRTNFSL